MKRTKKLLALVLALMMAFTTLVMPAMAADEGIMPRKPAFQCSYCGGGAELVERSGTYNESFWFGCTEYPNAHEHTYAYEEYELVCLSTRYLCGKREAFREVISEYCNGAHVYI